MAKSLDSRLSSVKTRKSDEQQRKIALIGHVSHQILGAKLPSNRQVLEVFFYNMRFVNLNAKESARLAIDAVSIFWQQARIPIREPHKCSGKLIKMYEDWKTLNKVKVEKMAAGMKKKVDLFISVLDDLFDIAACDALTMMRNEQDKVFLEKQRQKGRPGSMLGIDKKLASKERRSELRREKEEARISKHVQTSKLQPVVYSESEPEIESEYMEASTDSFVDDDNEPIQQKTSSVIKRNWITPRLCAALDKAKVSDRQAMHIIMAIVEALEISADHLVLNRTSLQQLRENNRHSQFNETKSEFIKNLSSNDRLVVHWDGKILADLVGRSNVDRIAVLVSYNGTAKFLGAPKIESGNGKNIAQAVHNLLVEWGISEKVVASSFDTTSSNTGLTRGACMLLDELLGRKLINLACRHHIYEIVLKSVFEKKCGKSSAPETLIFNRFADIWQNIKHDQYSFGINDQIVGSKISLEEIEQIKQFCRNQLKHTQIRGDYKELLELSMTFLGDDGGVFRTCGATSHARFMSKAIYCLKIFLFRDQFNMTLRELNCIRDMSVFILKLYIKVWYRCTNSIECPNQDLNFLRDAFKYSEIDKTVSEAVIDKMKNHLWYLTPETVGLSFFDPSVSLEIKRKMTNRLKEKDPVVALVKYRTFPNAQHLLECDLSDFVSYKTKFLFSNFELQCDFLELDPAVWKDNEEYQTALELFEKLFVVNDTAERGVKFMKDYNRILTHDEEEAQFILQVVDSYRKKFPSHTKSALIDQPQAL